MPPPPSPARPDAARARAFVQTHAGFVSRVLWSAGVPRVAIDDAAQQVFMVALERLDELRDPRAFLYTVATRTAHATRRSEARVPLGSDPDAAAALSDDAPAPDDLLSRKRARDLLDSVLEQMPDGVRTVFVLFEIEGMTMAEIATALELAPGTVASRLRRGREIFQTEAKRVRARTQRGDAR
ncbi:MAG: sigma-70 family RNA polymerase sigma factor [Polyangiaceae bacterium]